MTSDNRMTWDLILEVFDVLERHGYHESDNQRTGQASRVIRDLAHVYEGTRDAPYGTYLDQAPPSPHPQPGQPTRQAEPDAVLLTSPDVSTVLAALDVAADYKRDRTEMCADCPDQSCPACQTRLHDARAYDQMADRMLQTAEAAPAPHHGQTEPAGLPRQPRLAADKEAGQ